MTDRSRLNFTCLMLMPPTPQEGMLLRITGQTPGLTYLVEAVPDSIDAARAETEAALLGCRVYWGSHGCDLTRGHVGPHVCLTCWDAGGDNEGYVGVPPYYGPETTFYGEDADATARQDDPAASSVDHISRPDSGEVPA